MNVNNLTKFTDVVNTVNAILFFLNKRYKYSFPISVILHGKRKWIGGKEQRFL